MDDDAGPIHLLLAADARAAVPMAVALASALRHLDPRRRAVAHLLDGGLTRGQRARLGRVAGRFGAEARWPALDADRLAGVGRVNHLPPLACARLFAPDLIPGAARAVYLDVDLVVRCDVAELWRADLRGRPAGAVPDERVPTLGDPPWLGNLVAGLDPSAGYFNTGVMLLDLPAWRDSGVAGRALSLLREHGPRLHALDQDAINLALPGGIARVDRRWNLQVGRLVARRGPRQGFDAGGVHHFAGSRKPWTRGRHPHRRAWLAEVRRSGYLGPAGYAAWRARWHGRVAADLLRERALRLSGRWDRSRREVYL